MSFSKTIMLRPSLESSPTDGTGRKMFELTNFGMTIEVKKLCGKKKTIEILKNINAMVMGGEILAIMGPSGAGKTSLLECATLNHPPDAKLSGTVKVNNMILTNKMFKDHCYIVQQNDYLPCRLTCRETLIFAAKNCIIDSKRQISHVDDLIESVGLKECVNVRVGDEFFPGLSGGQKRRLSVCLALIKMPKFLFLDEPTSGLDSTSALKLCQLIRKLVGRFKMAAMLTIHQPNTRIYETFSKLMLLHKGKVMYFGPSNEAEKWFEEMGHPLPSKTNVADYGIDVLEDETFLYSHHKMFDLKRLSGMLEPDGRRSLIPPKRFSLLGTMSRPNVWSQMLSTLHKEILIIIRDPLIYTGRCLVFVFVGVFFALVYIKSRDRTQEQVLQRCWLIVWTAGCPTSMACVQVFVHSLDIINLKRDVRNGIQHPAPFVFSKLLQVPMMFLFSMCGLSVGGYLMGNWNLDKYGDLVYINALTLLSFELFAELVAASTPHFTIGVQAFLGYWFSSFLFCGLMVRTEDVIWPLRVLCYILPFRYGVSSMVHEEFIDSKFKGVERCNPNVDLGCRAEGFKCKTRACYGETGAEVLATLHVHFSAFSELDDTETSIMWLLIFCVSIKVLYISRIAFLVNRL